MIENISPHILKLAEGMEIPDDLLMSVIGKSDGKPYERLLETAKKCSTLNKYADSIHPSIPKYYLPFRRDAARNYNAKL